MELTTEVIENAVRAAGEADEAAVEAAVRTLSCRPTTTLEAVIEIGEDAVSAIAVRAAERLVIRRERRK